ncbi:MAG: (d)CMP kinase [Clostridia bacterium]|nr:(d)CMP kinase [Clostridia bacterium]MBO7170723.1 (d)CMP kinase [Clostridia bacterium]
MFYKIALDGPSGAGKSTLAKSLAKELGILYVDTGAMYRAIGLYVRDHGIAADDEAGVIACLEKIEVALAFRDGTQHVLLCGEDVGDRIRTPEISMYASRVSAIPAVRAFLLDTQRGLSKSSSLIMDGRDIGTVIFPDAEVKLFLVASIEARAKRRTEELLAKGMEVTYEDVLRDMQTRDKNDRERTVAPAVAAPDAILLDNSGMEPEETLATALRIIREKLGNV